MTPNTPRRAIAVVDLGFGDCGKGTMTDHLAAELGARLVVRFNGGAQAGHNVVAPDGRHHCFSQLGAATFQPGVETLLSQHVAIHPLALRTELAHLASVGVPDALARLRVDARALVNTPYHQCANRLRELARGAERHGSCGVGHGECVADDLGHPELTLRAAELGDRDRVRRQLARQREHKLDTLAAERAALAALPEAAAELAMLEDGNVLERIVDAFAALADELCVLDPAAVAALVRAQHAVVLEGAQGVLLDEWCGFHPHTTWSTTTFANARALLDEVGFEAPLERLGVLRTYAVRHGAGPFVGEDLALGMALAELHNTTNPWQGPVRVAPFDAVASAYAIAVCGGVDVLALTHLDALARLPAWRMTTRYRARTPLEGALPIQTDPESGDVVALAAPDSQDLDRQASLTAVLGRCAAFCADPIEQPGDDGGARVLEAIEAALGVRVGYTSSGPTRDDKRRRG